ncbi:MAG: type II toxin-antitoxin system VapC family toxin [Pseudomonadota bacterium]
MTAYLLDTNAFAMALTDDPRLPPYARDLMADATRLSVSAISFYEIGQKVRLGKWPEMSAHVQTLEDRALADGYDLVPVTAKTALVAAMLDWTHRDPFDRMIAAIAQHDQLPILSSDAAFDDIGVTRHWQG